MAITGKFSEIKPQINAKDKDFKEDVVRLLKDLGDLKSQGIITETEFEEKKKELLSRL